MKLGFQSPKSTINQCSSLPLAEQSLQVNRTLSYSADLHYNISGAFGLITLVSVTLRPRGDECFCSSWF